MKLFFMTLLFMCSTNILAQNNVLKPDEGSYVQNRVVSNYDDAKLLKMDLAMSNPKKKAKTLRTIGIVSGGALVVAGGVWALIAAKDGGNSEKFYGCYALLGGGAVCATTFLLIANHYQKQANMLQSSSLYQKEFNVGKGSSLAWGVDMIRDKSVRKNSLGLGLRYNF